MRIVFDDTTLEQGESASRSITAVLYFDFNGFFFPDERWNDFVVVILAWWLEAAEKLERGFEREVVFRFMDGPYWITLTRQDEDIALLRCTEDRTDAGVLYEEHVDVPEFIALIRRLARRILSTCNRRHLQSRETEALKKYLPNQ